MADAEREAFRDLAASVMAQDMILRLLFRMWLNQLDPAGRKQTADGLRAAIRRTETLTGSSADEFHAEMQADVAVLAQAKLDGILRLVSGPGESL